jgi:MFS family permease
VARHTAGRRSGAAGAQRRPTVTRQGEPGPQGSLRPAGSLAEGVPERHGRGSAGSTARAAAVATISILPVFLTGALAVQIRQELRFDETGLGLTVAAFFGTAALVSTWGGKIAEQLGPIAGMRLAAVLAAVASFAVAIAARSLMLLLLFLVVAGLSNAIGQPAANLFLARRVDSRRLGTALGIKQSAIPVATLLGGLAVPAVALTVGWRWAFAGAAAVAAVLALPRQGDDPVPRTGPARRHGSGDVALRPLVVLAVGIGLGCAAANTLGAFLVSAAVDAGMAEARAGLFAASASLAGVASRLFFGVRADRPDARHLVTASRMLAMGSAGYLLLATSSTRLMVVGGFLGYCLGWGWPGLSNLAVVLHNPSAPAAATGIIQTGTYFGAVLGPFLFGVAVDQWSYESAWVAPAVVSLVGAGVIAVGRRLLVADRPRRPEPTGRP